MADKSMASRIDKLVPKTLTIMASASLTSINEKVMNCFLKHSGFKSLNLRDFSKDIPLFLSETKPIPPRIIEICQEIEKYENLLIFAPEHNGYFSSFFKNIIDWATVVNTKILAGKQVVVVSASRTERTKRFMEEGTERGMATCGAQLLKFINYNRYDEATIEERNQWLTQEILGAFI